MTRTIKGLPVGVEIHSDAALEEVERLMLRASESKNLSATESKTLIDNYRTTRRLWLDSHYELNDEHLKVLQTADDRITSVARETIEMVCATLEREASLPPSERTISEAYIHLEENGLPLGCNNLKEMSDDEIYLWDLLFSEDHAFDFREWGFPMCIRNQASIDDLDFWRKCCEQSLQKTGEHGLSPLFWAVRDRYNVALQDMARITEFSLTVGYE